VADPTVQQGALEQSNVSAVDGMVSLIVLHRQFESYQRAMGLIDSITQKAIADNPA
jgi:flagellar basal body rod protein FlgG